ncbi:hypothetical protein HPB47_026795 [Ixodes persulcatus]|uniref:Uncharacterized protein n=1 Tax=Ixodes persulcatus TaxID=34615 RepID=A0AC60PXQ2_IXOPE|nr:hypothetical protein HPB47_026795 [Ixodes persulcatus]
MTRCSNRSDSNAKTPKCIKHTACGSFKAHKMVLAMRNEIFEAMFYGNLPEKDQVRGTDLHPDGFSAFLK